MTLMKSSIKPFLAHNLSLNNRSRCKLPFEKGKKCTKVQKYFRMIIFYGIWNVNFKQFDWVYYNWKGWDEVWDCFKLCHYNIFLFIFKTVLCCLSTQNGYTRQRTQQNPNIKTLKRWRSRAWGVGFKLILHSTFSAWNHFMYLLFGLLYQTGSPEKFSCTRNTFWLDLLKGITFALIFKY